MLLTSLFLSSYQSSSRRSVRTSGTGSHSSISSRNSQFSLQNVTWEASKTSLFGITERWILTWQLLPTDIFWALLRRYSASGTSETTSHVLHVSFCSSRISIEFQLKDEISLFKCWRRPKGWPFSFWSDWEQFGFIAVFFATAFWLPICRLSINSKAPFTPFNLNLSRIPYN